MRPKYSNIQCPDCGPVKIEPDANDHPYYSGLCPKCKDRIYFTVAPPKDGSGTKAVTRFKVNNPA